MVTSTTAASVPEIRPAPQIREYATIPGAYRSNRTTDKSGPMLSAAPNGGFHSHTNPTNGNMQNEMKYQSLGAAPANDISTSDKPPPMNSDAPETRRKLLGALDFICLH